MALKGIDKLIQARIKLQKEQPFFSFLVMQLVFRETPKEEMAMPTMGIDDDGNIYFCKEFVDKLTDAECKTVLCHEVMHCALEHLRRRNNREFELFNISTDMAINNILVTEGMNLPKDAIVPHNNEFKLFGLTIKKLHHKSAEEIYDEIYQGTRKEREKNRQSMKDFLEKHKGEVKRFDVHMEKGNGQGKGKEKKGVKGLGGDAKDWKKILVDACSYAKQQGHLPAGMKRLVDDLLETTIDWKSLLYKYVTNQIPIDYDWSYPSKRSFSTGIYMPRVTKEKIDVMIAIDTSGSISRDELSEFLSEITGIIKQFKNVDATIMDCDCQVNSVKDFRNASVDDIMNNLELRGGGGTSHLPVFKWIREHKPATRFLISFTDGYTSFPDKSDVSFPTLWVVAGSYRADAKDFPFGDVVELPIREHR